ncbi:MAG: universal stress protein [Deltaproteobacteria bacterium]|nr:universal stress protein [Deltaproteobacteria bacterium]
MFKKILVPVDVDHPEAATAVYQSAVEIAKTSGAEIRLVSVMPGFGMPIVASFISDDVRQEVRDRFNASLEKFIRENCPKPVSYSITTGKHWKEILKAADKWGADLIVVHHNRRHEINEVFSRSCAQSVADNAKCSVLWLRNIQV